MLLDGRDRFALFDSHPLNHQLFVQRNDPGQSFRLGPQAGHWTALADIDVGTQQVLDADYQTRYHGWFVADTYAAFSPLRGVELNLNLLFVNPSASDAYRVSSMIHPGLGLHLARDLFDVDGDPLRADVMGIDLGTVTTGNGLLLERVPLEGVVAITRWRSVEARLLYGGRALWQDDDYKTLTFSVLEGKAELNLVQWQRRDPPEGVLPPADDSTYATSFPMDQAYYATLSSRWPISDVLHLSTEYGYRAKSRPRVGGMARLDLNLHEEQAWAVHLGYQFRYYQAGFGPRDALITPSWPFNSLAQNDQYVTNPFEYHGISAGYDQWSHTAMGEGRVRFFAEWEAYLNSELWQRFARADAEPRFVAYTPDGFRAPGRRTFFFYELGLRFYPFRGLPHRGSFNITNHAIEADWSITTPVDRRYHRGTYYNVAMEAYL